MKQGWEIKKLGEVCEIKTGKKDVNQGNPDGNYPFFTCAREHTFSDTFSFDTEALLIAGNGDVGNVSYYKGKFEAYQRTYVLFDFKGIQPRFLFRVLDGTLKQVMAQSKLGNTMPYIKLGMLKEFEIPLPPLPEQQHIVSILDEAFAAIAKAKANAEQNLKNAKELFESYLQEVFEKKGEGWEKKKLGEVGFVKSGGTPSRSKKEYWSGNIAWYSSGELNDIYTTNPERHINELAIENSNAKLFPKGSLLIGMYDTAALKMSILDRDGTFNQAIAGVKPNPKIDLIFILHAINAIKPEILNLRRGVRQKNLSLEKIKNIPISLPPLKEQQTIVRQLDALRVETQKLEAVYQKKIADLEELKKSILQKAFKGELTQKEMVV
jgi:type I restriction enzyme S subunit